MSPNLRQKHPRQSAEQSRRTRAPPNPQKRKHAKRAPKQMQAERNPQPPRQRQKHRQPPRRIPNPGKWICVERIAAVISRRPKRNCVPAKQRPPQVKNLRQMRDTDVRIHPARQHTGMGKEQHRQHSRYHCHSERARPNAAYIAPLLHRPPSSGTR